MVFQILNDMVSNNGASHCIKHEIPLTEQFTVVIGSLPETALRCPRAGRVLTGKLTTFAASTGSISIALRELAVSDYENSGLISKRSGLEEH